MAFLQIRINKWDNDTYVLVDFDPVFIVMFLREPELASLNIFLLLFGF